MNLPAGTSPSPCSLFPVPCSLLLVDDTPEIALIVHRFGRRCGHVSVSRPNAESAWQYLQQERRPDLAILDLNLPGASGADLCRQVRREPRLADLPIALFSHWDRPEDIANGLDAGVNYVLSKELLCDVDAWQARLAEILPPASGHAPPLSLRWGKMNPSALSRLVARLNQALAQLARTSLGGDVVRLLVRRALELAVPARQREPLTQAPLALSADGLGLDPQRLGPTAAGVSDFVSACAEGLWRLLGTAGTLAFRTALDDCTSPDIEKSSLP